ncbi:ABC transporter ATP-binding protein [Glycomyces sp. L485]|uniref:ATP-binding cassette domain-containing protein n=1 Tax=Glycomyces sp. L485 TaxID=2909235 RepID=UPI001F4B7ECB|nr:ABC transporter ATP-binding protein [Glycomyces sp. L485]MCH7230754.1 ABC transporter ATP-binding protein [Glycomyces sp. L485]
MSETLLTVKELGVAIGGAEAVRELTFRIEPGETLAVVGESGAGKSLTAKAILGLLPQRSAVTGSMELDGHQLVGAGRSVYRRLWGRTLGYVPQDALTVLSPVHTVAEQLASSAGLVQGLDRRSARRAALAALESVGIAAERADAYPHEFSGGMRQRAVIAMATINGPKLIVADEPTTALDPRIQAQVLELLGSMCEQTGAALMLVTHDHDVVKAYADRVLAMRRGRQIPYVPEDADRPARTPVADPAPLLSVRDLTVDYAGTGRAVDGVSFDIAEGETLALIGESGCGKSSTASAVLQLRRPESGSVVFEGQELTRMTGAALRAVRPAIQPVLQDPYGSLSPRLTAGRAVAEPLRIQGRWNEDSPARIAELFDRVGLAPELADRYPHELSGGQCQRVNIARALVCEPRLLVLDEPTSALDPSLRQGILDLLRGLQERLGHGYLFICHDLSLVRGFAHRVAVMREGRIVETGPASQVRSPVAR